jgi:hypothetical protein
MSKKLGINTLQQIADALDKGATATVYPGFKPRNLVVAKDVTGYLLAFTFGTSSGTYTAGDPEWHTTSIAGLKPGGTAHTWNHNHARFKEHQRL